MQAFLKLCGMLALGYSAIFLIVGSVNVVFDLNVAFKVAGSAEPLPTDFVGVLGLTLLSTIIGALLYALGSLKTMLKLMRQYRWPVLGGLVVFGVAIALWVASILPPLRLEMALNSGNSAQAQTLLQKHDYSTEVLSHNLYWALESEDFDSAQIMLEQGADINQQRGEFEVSLLHSAVVHFPASATPFLLANGIDVNAKNTLGNNALHGLLTSRASFRETTEAEIFDLVRQLTEAGIDIQTPSSTERTPLEIAQEKGYNDIAAYLKATE